MFTWVLTNIDTAEVYKLQINLDEPLDAKGWEEMKFVHNRSKRFDGMFLDFSQQLEFFCKGGGKEFIDAANETKGSEANMTLDITYACDANTATMKSKLDFSTYSEKIRGGKLYTVINVEKVGITQLVKNRSKVDVDLLSETSIGGTALNPYPIQEINMHSKAIYMKTVYGTANHGCCIQNLQLVLGFVTNFIFPPFTASKADFDKSADLTTQCMIAADINIPYLPSAPFLIDTSDTAFVNKNTVTVKWNFSGEVTINTYDATTPDTEDNCQGCNPQSNCGDTTSSSNCGTGPESNKTTGASKFFLRLWYGETIQCAQESGRFIDLVTIPADNQPSSPWTRSFNGDDLNGFDIPIYPGDKIWVYWIHSFFVGLSMDLKTSFEYFTAFLSFETNNTANPTTAKALPIHEALSRICEGITDQTLAFKSEFFGRTDSMGISYSNNGYASFTAITDGYRIRGIEKTTDAEVEEGETKKGIITNLDDAYDSCNAAWGIGLGIETHNGVEVVRMEEKTYFYSETIILTLDDVPNIEMSFDTERAYSAIELGFDKWKPELKNGLDEPLTTATWEFTKIKSFSNVLTLKSKYVAGMYAIETTRRKNIVFKTTDDSTYDDDIFFIALNRSTTGADYTEGLPTNLSTPEKNERILVVSETTGTFNSLIDPDSAYNLRFNLFSIFDRLMNQFTTNLTKDTPQPINYSYFEGNGQMRFTYFESPGHAGDLNGSEADNVQNTTAQHSRHRRKLPIFLPEKYTFTYPLEFSTYINILNNPYGKIRFSGDGVNYFEGWILNLEYQIKTGMTNFTIIRKYGS